MRVSTPQPLLYEINTRCWLAELSAAAGSRVALDQVPEAEFRSWSARGFTHIWLMGVWSAGPRASKIAQSQESLKTWAAKQQLPAASGLSSTKARQNLVAASPYAIASYKTAPEFGGDKALGTFRQKLNAAGLKLILDFVPNHTGLDHPWLRKCPGLFVSSKQRAEGTFEVNDKRKRSFVAHGRDPYFPPWIDTAQLDYRNAATHGAMSDVLMSIAARCDGVRCDMAMLVLRDVFERTWEKFPTDDRVKDEFWPAAIQRVKERFPRFMFLAEAYWGLEMKLVEAGFDFAYDKALYDYLVKGDPQDVCKHIYSQSPRQLGRSAHFIENHDEQRAAAAMPLARHRAAAMLILSLPGMRFLHEGQLTGAKLRVPVQATKRPNEPADPEVQAMYDQLLTMVKESNIGRGDWKLLKFGRGDGPVFGIHWSQNESASAQEGFLSLGTLAIINMSDAAAEVSLPETVAGAGWILLGQAKGASLSMDAARPAKLSLPSYGWALLQVYA